MGYWRLWGLGCSCNSFARGMDRRSLLRAVNSTAIVTGSRPIVPTTLPDCSADIFERTSLGMFSSVGNCAAGQQLRTSR